MKSDDDVIDEIIGYYRSLRYPSAFIYDQREYRVVLVSVNAEQRCDSVVLQISRFYIGIVAFGHLLSRFRKSDVTRSETDGYFFLFRLRNGSILKFMCDVAIAAEMQAAIAQSSSLSSH